MAQVAEQGWRRGFWSLIVTQFQGAFSDNALKFLIHFIADLHQPLHAADHDDKGGNCIGLSPRHGRETNLHAYWDVGVSGLSAGYFIGWLISVLKDYRSAPAIADDVAG